MHKAKSPAEPGMGFRAIFRACWKIEEMTNLGSEVVRFQEKPQANLPVDKGF